MGKFKGEVFWSINYNLKIKLFTTEIKFVGEKVF
jgi:hypothetical protein